MKVHWPTAAITVALAALATLVLVLLQDTLRRAPQTVFPLMMLVFVGGAFVFAWIHKRRQRGR